MLDQLIWVYIIKIKIQALNKKVKIMVYNFYKMRHWMSQLITLGCCWNRETGWNSTEFAVSETFNAWCSKNLKIFRPLYLKFIFLWKNHVGSTLGFPQFFFQTYWYESEPGIWHRQQNLCDTSTEIRGEVCAAAWVRQQIPHNTVWVAQECGSLWIYYEGLALIFITV